MSRAFSVFRSSLSLLRLASLLSFKFSALAAPLRRSCSALVLAALAAAGAGAQPADDWVIETVAGGGSSLGDGGAAVAAQLNIPYGLALDGAGNLYIADKSNHRIRKVVGAGPPAPAAPVARPREPEPAVRARTLELAFVLRQDDAPAAQQVVLYAENGAVDFCAQPGQRWISVEPASGSLEEDEEAVLTVTVDPAGLRVGRREGRVYVRSGGG